MNLVYMAVLLWALLNCICGKQKGLVLGWPLADHRRQTQFNPKDPALPNNNNEQRLAPNAGAPQINLPILPKDQGSGGPPRDTSGRDIRTQNFDFLQPIPQDQQGAFLLSSQKIFPDRDGPDDRDREIPDSFFKEVQSKGSATSPKVEHNDNHMDSKAEIHAAPYFALLPNPGQQPDTMQDYALLDEADDQKETPVMPPIIALPPILLKDNRITKIPIMTASIEDVLLPTVPIPKSTTATRKRQQVLTPRPKTPLIRASMPQKATSRADQTSVKTAKNKGVTSKPAVQDSIKKLDVQPRSATDIPKEHRGQKRSPQQPFSYIPAFRRRQTIPNPFIYAPNRAFANSGDAHFGNTQTVQNSPYRPVKNGRATDRNAFQNVPYDNVYSTAGYGQPFGLSNGRATDRNAFQNVPYDNVYSTAGYGQPFGLSNNNPPFLHDSNPLLTYGSPTIGLTDRIPGYNVPVIGYNNGFSIATPPLQNTFLPYGGGSQIPAFIGGSLGVGLPNLALTYPISTLASPIFPSYLNGFATTGPFQQFPIQNQGILAAQYYNPIPEVNPLHSSQGYSFGMPGFDANPYNPREFLNQGGVRHRNNTESYRSAESYEIDSLNGYNRPPRRKNAKPALRPTLDGFIVGMPGQAPIGQSISELRPPVNFLPPAPFYPTLMTSPPMPFGMPNHLTAIIPRRPSGKNGFSGRLPHFQTGQFHTPEDYFNTDFEDFDFPDQIKKPDYDEDDFKLQEKPKKKDFIDGVMKQPEKSNSGSRTFKMQPDKTGSSQPVGGIDSFEIEDDDKRFPTMSSADKVTEQPITIATDIQSNEGGSTGALGSLPQEIPQNNEADSSTSTGKQKMDTNMRENGTASMPQLAAQDRFSTDDSPYETLYYQDNVPSHKPTLLAYFYPRRTSSTDMSPLHPNLNYHGISINDPQIWKYFKPSEETSAPDKPVSKSKQTRKSKSSRMQECTDLFGSSTSCKTSKSKRKPKSKTKQKEPELPYEVINGGLFLDFGEGAPQQYSDGSQLFYNGPQIFPFNEPQEHNFNIPQQSNFNEPLQQNFKIPQLPNLSMPQSLNLEPYYPLPPPNTVPLAHVENSLLSQSAQSGWRPIAGPPRQPRRNKPLYNRQHFQAQPPPISPHGHPALHRGIQFPK